MYVPGNAIAGRGGEFRAAVEKAEPFFRPLMVKMKLLWECNLACAMCDYWRQGGSSPLSFGLVTRILDDLAALGCLKVHFSGGEPTIRPDSPLPLRAASSCVPR